MKEHSQKKQIDSIVENIMMIEEHIKLFNDIKPLFFQKKKLQKYDNIIENLECIKMHMYKILEYKIDEN